MYVIELGHGIEERYTHKHRTHLYVGQTQNTVSRRMRSNLTRADRKTVVSLDEARESPGVTIGGSRAREARRYERTTSGTDLTSTHTSIP